VSPRTAKAFDRLRRKLSSASVQNGAVTMEPLEFNSVPLKFTVDPSKNKFAE
jgi:hypothetical protein